MAHSPPHLRLVAKPSASETSDEVVSLDDFDAAFRAYARYVGAIGLRILGRPDEVDDLVQEVFLAAHRQRATLREPAALKGWLATLTVRKATRVLKKRRLRRLMGLDQVPDYAQVASPSASPAQVTLVGEVYQLLDFLPSEERTAWVLRRIEQHTLSDVAELCGCSLATAKRRVSAAEAKLQGKLGHG
ncbi:MAG: RNA polymerase sigma factor [Sandaracinaceae bacterium]